MRNRLTRIILGACLLVASPLRAATVVVAWDASASGDATGYRLLYGTTSGSWPTTIDVGNVTLAPLTLSPGTYFVTVVAYNVNGTSPPAPELAVAVAPIDTSCDYPLGPKAISIFPTALQKTGSGGAGSKARLDFQVASPNSPITRVAVKTNGVDLRAMTGLATATPGVDDLAALAGLWFVVPAAPATYALSVVATNAYGCVREQSTTYAITVAP